MGATVGSARACALPPVAMLRTPLLREGHGRAGINPPRSSMSMSAMVAPGDSKPAERGPPGCRSPSPAPFCSRTGAVAAPPGSAMPLASPALCMAPGDPGASALAAACDACPPALEGPSDPAWFAGPVAASAPAPAPGDAEGAGSCAGVCTGSGAPAAPAAACRNWRPLAAA